LKGSSNGVLEVLYCNLSGWFEEKREKPRTVPADNQILKTTMARTFVLKITGDLNTQNSFCFHMHSTTNLHG
jgi:hypothetical protein